MSGRIKIQVTFEIDEFDLARLRTVAGDAPEAVNARWAILRQIYDEDPGAWEQYYTKACEVLPPHGVGPMLTAAEQYPRQGALS